MDQNQEKLTPLEEGLLTAMRALDNQIMKEVGKRSPADLETRGVQKWEPYQTRVERVCSFVLDALGTEQLKLDSLLVMSQAMVKTLELVVDELGPDGLGQIRTGYCTSALEQITKDAERGLQAIKGGPGLM